MNLLLYSVLALVFLSANSHASLVGWILGRDSSPFNILSSEKQFEQLMSQAEENNDEPPDYDSNAVQARSDIPFELTVADEKFIADAQKYTDLSLSELDMCQHKVNIKARNYD